MVVAPFLKTEIIIMPFTSNVKTATPENKIMKNPRLHSAVRFMVHLP